MPKIPTLRKKITFFLICCVDGLIVGLCWLVGEETMGLPWLVVSLLTESEFFFGFCGVKLCFLDFFFLFVEFKVVGDEICRGISWATKDKVQQANYFGSLTQASSIRVGSFNGEEIYAPFKSLLPMVYIIYNISYICLFFLLFLVLAMQVG